MAQLKTPAIRSAGSRTPKNYFRFYPGRKPRQFDGRTDDRILFESAVYARIQDAEEFHAGIVVGPTLDRILDGGREMLQGGSGLVEAKAEKRGGEIMIPPVRKFPVPNTRAVKSFMDLVTLKFVDGKPIAVPFEEDNVVYFEVCTGDPQESEEAYIAALSGLWLHGSAEYMGSGILPAVSAPSKKRAKKKAVAESESAAPQEVRVSDTSVAQLWGEAVGAMVNGVPLWWTRVWKTHYSRDESEVIIVRQQSKYYKLYVSDGRADYHDCSGQVGIEQDYLDNIAKLAKVGVQNTPLLVPSTGIILTTDEAPAESATT